VSQQIRAKRSIRSAKSHSAETGYMVAAVWT
jgi:hypothetical protein